MVDRITVLRLDVDTATALPSNTRFTRRPKIHVLTERSNIVLSVTSVLHTQLEARCPMRYSSCLWLCWCGFIPVGGGTGWGPTVAPASCSFAQGDNAMAWQTSSSVLCLIRIKSRFRLESGNKLVLPHSLSHSSGQSCAMVSTRTYRRSPD